LSQQEGGTAYWKFDGVDAIAPRLHLLGASESSILPESLRRQLEAFLANASGDWNPFDE
jgi:hypothetical protein